jgi:hypothetical protein
MLQTAPGSGHGDAACAVVALAPNPMAISMARRAVCPMYPLVGSAGDAEPHSREAFWRRACPFLRVGWTVHPISTKKPSITVSKLLEHPGVAASAGTFTYRCALPRLPAIARIPLDIFVALYDPLAGCARCHGSQPLRCAFLAEAHPALP